jgi:hypothetical protein
MCQLVGKKRLKNKTQKKETQKKETQKIKIFFLIILY